MQTKTILPAGIDALADNLAGKKILFANFPADGHFNPLTGLAVHLKWLGCDVRWYTSAKYAEKISALGIPHYPLNKALDISRVEKLFLQRDAIKGQIAKFNFDIINVFILRGPEYYADLQEIQGDFPFDLVVADCAFTGIPFISDKLGVPVVSIGVFPLTEASRDLAPTGLGMAPSSTIVGKIKQRLLHLISDHLLFRRPNKLMHSLLKQYGIDHPDGDVFNLLVKKSTLLLQSGTPGFEYYRSDLGENIRFIGPLLPYRSKKQRRPWHDPRITQFEKIILVTQGTVERDINKLLVPTLEAFKNSDVLVVATTGGSGTAELRKRFPQANILIEDFIPFADIMPYADVYVTNGGYGGVMLSVENRLPLVVAGVHEGKNEINARIAYFRLGINLKTESPQPIQIKKAVEEVLAKNIYTENISKLAREFESYDPNERCTYHIREVLEKTGRLNRNKKDRQYATI